jgi:hypothetical protein
LYEAATVMGFAAVIDQWEPWQVGAAMRGWRAANCPPKVRAPSDAEFRAAVERTVH